MDVMYNYMKGMCKIVFTKHRQFINHSYMYQTLSPTNILFQEMVLLTLKNLHTICSTKWSGPMDQKISRSGKLKICLQLFYYKNVHDLEYVAKSGFEFY